MPTPPATNNGSVFAIDNGKVTSGARYLQCSTGRHVFMKSGRNRPTGRMLNLDLKLPFLLGLRR